ncbi:hypothetical protein T492DRAFT_957654 [Pavlovales sp. CCMP2436]|nr:hypothetical protein T492DRAFT_957654 [Pavlovales sp. CCMP2436]|mmetsp:Transcript_24659/g.58220  ORF Transcript_24659/g.58220 Transcript_24659/m.58220 type:complete len:316 (+) Transcript_24659:137-1084(+)
MVETGSHLPLLTGLPSAMAELILTQLDPSSIARAQLVCRAMRDTMRDAGLWRIAFELRWGGGGKANAAVGKMTYILRHTCERLSRDGAVCKVRREGKLLGGRPIDNGDDEELEHDWPAHMGKSRYLEEVEQEVHLADEEQAKALENIHAELQRSSPSAASADAMCSALERGLSVLSSNIFFNLAEEAWNQTNVVKFAVWSSSGSLVVFHALGQRYHKSGNCGVAWQLHAHIVGVPDASLSQVSRWDHPMIWGDKVPFLDYFDWLLRLDWENAGKPLTDCITDPMVYQPPDEMPGSELLVLIQNCAHFDAYKPGGK